MFLTSKVRMHEYIYGEDAIDRHKGTCSVSDVSLGSCLDTVAALLSEMLALRIF